MNEQTAKLAFLALLALAVCGCAANQSMRRPDEANLGRQILLTVKESSVYTLRLAGAPGKTYLKRRGYRGSPETERILEDIADQYSLTRLDGWRIGPLGVYCEVYEVDDKYRLPGVIDQLNADPRVESAQPMNEFDVLAYEYDDPYFELQSAAHAMDIASAHHVASGRGVKVAVVDTGVDSHHPDLRGPVYLTRNFVDTKRVSETDIHGTAVAGIIASSANNHTGIVGMAPDVAMLALKACWPVSTMSVSARCSSFTLAKAIGFAVDAGAHVLNLSLTGPHDPLLARLVDAALAQGMIVVTAYAGPDEEKRAFPGSVNGVIVVESVEDMSPGENVGRSDNIYRVAAPGHNIITTAPDSGYEFLSGNSLAAAHVSGITALLLEHSPKLSPQDIAELLHTSSRNEGDANIVNACVALAQLITSAQCKTKLAEHH